MNLADLSPERVRAIQIRYRVGNVLTALVVALALLMMYRWQPGLPSDLPPELFVAFLLGVLLCSEGERLFKCLPRPARSSPPGEQAVLAIAVTFVGLAFGLIAFLVGAALGTLFPFLEVVLTGLSDLVLMALWVPSTYVLGQEALMVDRALGAEAARLQNERQGQERPKVE